MSRTVVVVERPERWAIAIPGVELVAARAYLTDPGWGAGVRARVYNLCRSYRYQSIGYYVSLLAEARSHRPLPDVATIQDLTSQAGVRVRSEELDAVIQRSLGSLASDRFALSVYFGANLAARHRRLSQALFRLFPAPFLRAQFVRQRGRWSLTSLRPLTAQELGEDHRDFAIAAAREYFSGRRPRRAVRRETRWDLAILYDPSDELAPSDAAAIRRFRREATRQSIRTEIIGRDDVARLVEFDALFIRQTTAVDHHTYRFARRAADEGLVVIDDPESILRCTNKVFLAEILQRYKVPAPRTVIVHRDNVSDAMATVGLPAILKLPEGSFSVGVVRCDTETAFATRAAEFLDVSDLVLAQEYLPTDFDWRIGVLARRPLFAARYLMAPGHWQIVQRTARGALRYGGTRAVPIADVPEAVLDAALRAAGLIGDGLYGVDLKELDGRPFVIEVNDNPSLDAGCEDEVEGLDLYRRLVGYFLDRLERRAGGGPG